MLMLTGPLGIDAKQRIEPARDFAGVFSHPFGVRFPLTPPNHEQPSATGEQAKHHHIEQGQRTIGGRARAHA
jgi:hypothetical protein